MDEAVREARANPGKVELLYEDEVSIYRQPSQASLFCPRGRQQPRLSYACGQNTLMRVAGFLNACSGAVHSWDAPSITADKLAEFFKQIGPAYPKAEKIYIVLDNWPVHYHAKIERVIAADPRLTLLWLPTYAPWLNPIEKLWKLVKQNVVHAHPLASDFNSFKKTVRDFLAKPTEQPKDLLRYVSLLS